MRERALPRVCSSKLTRCVEASASSWLDLLQINRFMTASAPQ
ncbi:Protein of unknown function [Pyronema omphalodes CBS 100304]|uniref:Uncharacterized protein n=1 Tax=Pyronema omphalodes (strain CBS 100304) TaxID=1076935 RepID=U4L758_PYROM|nr:Protein of unknown function [Pyronema omphalodes CBS 100304]